jgi:hypothetical protein
MVQIFKLSVNINLSDSKGVCKYFIMTWRKADDFFYELLNIFSSETTWH